MLFDYKFDGKKIVKRIPFADDKDLIEMNNILSLGYSMMKATAGVNIRRFITLCYKHGLDPKKILDSIK